MDVVTYAILKKSKADLVNGKVPAEQLPSYVSEVVEVATKSDLPATGDKSKIYLTLDNKQTYRWSGSTYVLVGGVDMPLTTDPGLVLVSTDTSGQVEWSDDLKNKQDKLISGTNIKTVNGQSILGEGDLPAGLVDDVKVDGVSVITNKIANIDLTPYAKNTSVDAKVAAEAAAREAVDSTLSTRIASTETAISTLGGRVTTAETEITGLKSSKQDVISDLATIREGAGKGATALQPGNNVSQLVNDAGYLTQHQSLAEYAKTAEVNTAISAAVNTEKLAREAADTALELLVAEKQDKLTAGSHIQILNNTISALDATIDRSFTTTITVGHLPAGTAISSSQTLKNILYTILCGDVPPVTTFFSQYKESVTVPTLIDSTWTQNEISEAVKTSGLQFKVTGDLNRGFLSFAYNKSLGHLTGIYQNPQQTPFNILSFWAEKEVSFNGIDYYMYYYLDSEDPPFLAKNDIFELRWQ